MSIRTKNDLAGGSFLPWYSLLLLLIIVLIGLFVGQGIGLALIMMTGDYTFQQLANVISPPFTEQNRMPIYLLQGLGTLGGFIVAGAVYLWYFERVRAWKIFTKTPEPGILFISLVMVVAFMFANSVLIEWNSGLHFPAALGGFEDWARGKENELKLVTDFLTRFNSPGDFAIGFIIIVLLPAFGEEFLFRGIIQNKLEILLRNGHVAIWLTALLFSAFHFQFFGFVPRMMLGVLFGYMYYWSRNIWFPVMAHFINNGFTLTMIYLYNEGLVGMDIEDEKAIPLYANLIFVLIGIILLIYYRQYFRIKSDPAAHE